MLLVNNSVQNWQNLPISNPKPKLHNINAQTKFGENPLIFTQIIIWKKNKDVLRTDNCQKLTKLPISNLKPEFQNINAQTKFGENPLIFTTVIIQKWKYEWMHNIWTDKEIKALQTLHDTPSLQGNKTCRKEDCVWCVITLPKIWCTVTVKQYVL